MQVRPWQPGEARPAEPLRGTEFIGLADITAFLRRYLVSILACAAAGIILALFSVLTTDPTYTSTAQILIEPKLPQYLQTTSTVSTSLDTAQIESQITVMKSEKITQMVIDQLGLMDNPDFFILREATLAERLRRFAGAILGKLGLAPEPPPFDPLGPTAAAGSGVAGSAGTDPAVPVLSDFERGRIAIDLFAANSDIRRVGVSYAVAIAFRSRNPQLAADVANATADSFVREQIETKAAQARQGGEWLERRMGEMRDKMNTATQIAQEFRARHDYRVQPPGARLRNGQLIYDDPAGETSDQPTLEELEVTADTYRQMYESFLRAYTDNLSQQSYPVADARVITAATQPLAPSYPRKKLVLAFGLLAGLMAGVGQAFLRHTLDGALRSPRQVEERLRLRCLAALPASRSWRSRPRRPEEIAEAPRSVLGESLRRVRFAIQRAAGEPIRALGVVSAAPAENRSMIASNLAVLHAMSGLRTLLVDADTDHALLTRRLLGEHGGEHGDGGEHGGERRDESDGERDGDRGGAPATAGIVPGPRGVDLLTLAPDGDAARNTARNTAGTMAGNMLGRPWPSDAYDMVVVDLPPLTAGFEALALGGRLDAVIIVAERGGTPIEAVEELAAMLRAHGATVSGVILD
ncbi:GumC family protein [Amaricoccus sp. W119]|uniref:GumC family protein n=1 Tax=Amaricoccus sp. W119 TaxID=3391833 RepID=UPI0039A467D0